MPEVFASGFLVGLIEWACIKALNPYLDWPKEQTVETYFNISHVAATPAGFEVLTKVKLIEADGKSLVFEVEAHDGIDIISRGTHERFVIKKSRFDEKIKQKAVSTSG